ncbi:DNA/RNA non-specific endonuclease [Cellulomonas fimi]|uniref:DNA/RNA non-specific endonuclease n=1 Tax=Cellulomonas fimi (strain ATCC 484 / DSM 20113 / JCM 1341 / CCUG 24087 / LMG 16345 / NBRC 15513 / NCIMB 8980 / NCTC 7547 / NRS-133) TaxID=590998 RepID=F4H0H0_CELFA|nr:DNA/RNA non-specific endonuclease [Cellulomonas fimi ATCC 484]NNH05831.1 DNA/RNA non-specific endonuclease [Cellulomonas fimi]VEH35973.1 DNA/RNA non-specific endonuclease [Cellulomonas fimi]
MDHDLDHAGGYDPFFLGPPLPLPGVPRPVEDLPSTHFTVLFDTTAKLAAATAVNIDGDQLLDLPRDDRWELDPRVPADQQAGPGVYRDNRLDRGHLVRRADPVWGPPDVARRANTETFRYTNAAPQVDVFNQGKELWVGLEDHVLEYAETWRQRLSVLTGPVLRDDDPVYRGVGVPRHFWKVAVWATPDRAGVGHGDDGPRVRLASAGFLVDQTPMLGGVDLDEATRAARDADVPPPLGPFRTFQVPVSTVAELTGLDLGPAVDADVLPPTRARDAEPWVTLTRASDIVL